MKPIPVDEGLTWKMNTKTLLAIIGGAVIAAGAWFSLKADVSTHGTKIDNMSAAISDDHDQLKIQGAILQQQQSMLERIDRKLDSLNRTRGGGGYGSGSAP
jgi:hypothetical protein